MSVAGSIESVTWNKRNFSVAQDSDATVELGGKNIESQSNGDGGGRNIVSIVPWKVSGIAVVIDDMTDDQEFLQDGLDAAVDKSFTITYASGAVYQGVGLPSKVERSSAAGTASLDFGGPFKLTKQ